MSRQTRREDEAYELAAEQAQEATFESETDDTSVDADEALEASEEAD